MPDLSLEAAKAIVREFCPDARVRWGTSQCYLEEPGVGKSVAPRMLSRWRNDEDSCYLSAAERITMGKLRKRTGKAERIKPVARGKMFFAGKEYKRAAWLSAARRVQKEGK